VLYFPTKPESAQIDRFAELWFVPLALGAMAFIAGIIGIVALMRRSI
jgi:hypothetical protein